MNELQLSKRLQKVVDYIPEGAKLADIGSDHAYLPCYAYMKNLITYAIAGEVNDGPYQSALSQVKRNDLEHVISVRLGNGLEVIKNNEVDVITIAGMGGQLITSILENGKEKLSNVKRLILQPNVTAIYIREWLQQNGWKLTAESIIEEDGKIYEVLVAEHGHCQYAQNELLLGPMLLNEKNSVFIKKWTHELKNWERIYKQLKHADQREDVQLKKEELAAKISLVKETIGK
jgi:tRNA (adenine22-N1)-methyltransferase